MSHPDDPRHLPPVSQTKHHQSQQWKRKDIFSFTYNHLVGGDVGVAEAGDVGLAGLDGDLVLIHLSDLAILGNCLFTFLPETLKAFAFLSNYYKTEKETVLTGLTTKSILFIITLVCFSTYSVITLSINCIN